MGIQRTQSITISSGELLICDPGYLFELQDEFPYVKLPSNVALFADFGGDGNFKVHSNGETIVVDTAPRQFKAKTQTGFEQIAGTVPVDYGLMVFCDSRLVPREALEAEARLLVRTSFPNGEYKVWEEVKSSSWAQRNRILCIGPTIDRFIHGPAANDLADVEKEIAAAFRLKGHAKGKRMKELGTLITEMYRSGIRTRRLKELATLLKVKLPR